jgi:hypothetical protein
MRKSLKDRSARLAMMMFGGVADQRRRAADIGRERQHDQIGNGPQGKLVADRQGDRRD